MFEQNIKCPICFNVVDEPFESSCCGHLFCRACVKSLKTANNCAICRSSKVNYRENTFVKVLLDTLQVKCPNGCETSIPISNVKYHRYMCKAAMFVCSLNVNNVKCNYEGPKKEALKHFADKHADQMVILSENFDNFKNIFEKHAMFDKLNKIVHKERGERDAKSMEKDEEELNQIYLNQEINANTNKLHELHTQNAQNKVEANNKKTDNAKKETNKVDLVFHSIRVNNKKK